MTQVSQSAGFEEPASEDVGAQVMLRVRAGDPEAFPELVRRYQKAVLNAVFKYTGNRAIAEELTQDVFVRVFRARETYERKAKFDTWLYRIVFNLCANAAEYGRRRRMASIDQEAAEIPGETPAQQIGDPEGRTPLEEMERRELREQVRAAIARLPEQQRAALILSRYRGMPYQEIAATLDTSVEAIKSLLFRARDNLRQSLLPYLREEVHDER